MLKKTVTYKDYDENERTEDFYFNLTKAEVFELELGSVKGKLTDMIEKIVKENNNQELIKLFKKVVLMAYGQKSLDGRTFIKNDEIRAEFEQTEAYSVIFMELATDADAAVSFFNGIIPQSPQDHQVKQN